MRATQYLRAGYSAPGSTVAVVAPVIPYAVETVAHGIFLPPVLARNRLITGNRETIYVKRGVTATAVIGNTLGVRISRTRCNVTGVHKALYFFTRLLTGPGQVRHRGVIVDALEPFITNFEEALEYKAATSFSLPHIGNTDVEIFLITHRTTPMSLIAVLVGITLGRTPHLGTVDASVGPAETTVAPVCSQAEELLSLQVLLSPMFTRGQDRTFHNGPAAGTTFL